MAERKALWQGEGKMLRNLKNAVRELERLGLDHPKSRALLTEIEDVLYYYPKWEKHVPAEFRSNLRMLASRSETDEIQGEMMNREDVAKELVRAARELVGSSLLVSFAANADVKVSRRRGTVVLSVTERYSAPPMVAKDVVYSDKRMQRSMDKTIGLIEKAYKSRVSELRFSQNPYTHLSAGNGNIGFMREVTIMGGRGDHDVLMELADELES